MAAKDGAAPSSAPPFSSNAAARNKQRQAKKNNNFFVVSEIMDSGCTEPAKNRKNSTKLSEKT
jgi:hypothetical protein